MTERWTSGLPENFPVIAANSLAGRLNLPEDRFCFRPPYSENGEYTIGVKSVGGNVPCVIVKTIKINVRVSRPVVDNVLEGNV